MLSPNVRFESWSTEDWRRFLSLWKPRAERPEDEAARPRGGLVVVHDGTHVRKLLHTRRGRLPLAVAASPERPSLADLAAEHDASWALGMHLGALDEVMERFGSRARREDDLTDQAILLVGIVRELIHEGEIEAWPRRLRNLPLPTTPMVRRTLDTLCADGHTIVLGMFKGGELWTALVARRHGWTFDLIAGPEDLRPAMGLLSGDWRRDYRHLARAVEERYAPLSFGCFAEVDDFRALQLDARPGAWGRAIALRDLVISPMPSAVGIALGADGARYAWERMRGVRRRVDPLGLLDPLVDRLRQGVAAVTAGNDVSGSLGFDPMEALRALLKR